MNVVLWRESAQFTECTTHCLIHRNDLNVQRWFREFKQQTSLRNFPTERCFPANISSESSQSELFFYNVSRLVKNVASA